MYFNIGGNSAIVTRYRLDSQFHCMLKNQMCFYCSLLILQNFHFTFQNQE